MTLVAIKKERQQERESDRVIERRDTKTEWMCFFSKVTKKAKRQTVRKVSVTENESELGAQAVGFYGRCCKILPGQERLRKNNVR